MSNQKPIRLALIGAGTFARKDYLPALRSLRDTFEVVAVVSRTLKSAKALAAELPGQVEATTNLERLLARDHDDVEAVSIITPIPTLPALVKKALNAGKHVISEKPVAPDVATGHQLLARYAGRADKQVWMVAENWRYEPAFLRAAEVLSSGTIGQPSLCHWTRHSHMSPENIYYLTPWRRSGEYPGGFLLDGGIHYIAAMRLILGEVAQVGAMVAQMRSDLPPADTLGASIEFENGTLGAYAVTYATTAPRIPHHLHVVGALGVLKVNVQELTMITGDKTHTEHFESAGVLNELTAFGAAIRHGTSHHNTPEQALRDVAVLEAMFEANEQNQTVSPDQIENF